MRSEVLELKRTCFCLPLRYSLLFCGYGRLICIVLDMCMTTVFLTDFEDNIKSIIYLNIFSLIMDLLDFILVVIFIVGAHKKSVKLLKTFYFYDLGLLILVTLICVGCYIYKLCTTIMLGGFERNFNFNTRKMLSGAAYLFLCLGLKGYVLLLVRSEITKLGNNSQFRFVNNAAESECTMEYNKTGDEEQGLAKDNDELSEIKDNSSDSIRKLKNKRMHHEVQEVGEADIGTETLSDEEKCKS